MSKTLLDLIATQKREEIKTELLYPLSEAKIASDIQYSLGGFFEMVDAKSKNPIQYSRSPLEIGAEWLDDLYDLNVHIPKTFEIQSVTPKDISVLDMPSISDVSEGFYRAIIPCNFYAKQEYEFVGMEPCPPFSQQEENYLKYVEKLKNNGNIFDVFAIFTGEKGLDTPLGLVGAEALQAHFQRNIEKNGVQIVGEYLETDPFRFVQTNNLLKVPYDITIPKSGLGKFALFLEKLSGAYFPFSYLPEDAFNLNNNTDFPKEQYTSVLLEYTGRGQKQELQRLLTKNKFTPLIIDDNYAVKDNQYVYIGKNAPMPFTDEFNGEYNLETNIEEIFSKTGVERRPITDINIFHNPDYGVNSISKNSTNPELFSDANHFRFGYDEEHDKSIWNRNSENTLNPKGLLHKTKKIVNNNTGVNGPFMDVTDHEFTFKESGGFVTISKGDAVTAYDNWPVDNDRLDYQVKKGDFFRTWTKDRKYSKLNRAIFHRGLDRGITSVLGNNGLINFAPTFRSSNGTSIKKYMFSIENLAWTDYLADLPECEKGDGDALTGHKGRIMWFPPYDLTFNESVNVSWNDHNFIGRGEPIYTYNNTTRSGSINFTMIVDHPSIVNKIRGERTEIWERYFKGDKSVEEIIKKMPTKGLSQQQLNEIENIRKNNIKNAKKTNEPILPPKQQETKKLEDDATKVIAREDAITFTNVYFPNNVSEIPQRSGSIVNNVGYQSKYQAAELDYTYYKGVKRDLIYEKKTGRQAYPNRTNYNLNDNFFDDAYIQAQFDKVFAKVKEINATSIYFSFIGYASQATPTDTTNFTLSEKRANNLKTWFISKLNKYKSSNDLGDLIINTDTVSAMSDFLSPDTGDDIDRDVKASVEARKGEIKVEFDVTTDPNADETRIGSTLPTVLITANYNQDANLEPSDNLTIDDFSSDILEKLFGITECDMFEYMEVYEPHTYKTISEKIKFFHPAFHSMTPEGFNGRLNFLHQCTRQSQNIGVDGIDNLTNFAFGRPPICILRIGDFFHTKMIIKSLGIDYEQPKWDLNPQGFVAPMIAKITLSVEFIGGQSLIAPINRLQNALSYNFYASMNMFDPRADSVYLTADSTIKPDGLQGHIEDGVKLSQIVRAIEVSNSSKTVSDTNIINKNNPPVQKFTPVSTPSSQNNVQSDFNVQSIASLKALLNLPLTEEEKNQ